MAIKQISIFVENKEGKLVTITDAIANVGIDIRALSVADTQDFDRFLVGEQMSHFGRAYDRCRPAKQKKKRISARKAHRRVLYGIS